MPMPDELQCTLHRVFVESLPALAATLAHLVLQGQTKAQIMRVVKRQLDPGGFSAALIESEIDYLLALRRAN